MRRAISAAVVGGLVLGAVAATPAYAVEGGHSAARQAAPAETRTGTSLKTVVYDGYQLSVPASWPVYRLDEHPTTCVRYDVHAVYLGTPGANMNCPAGLIGRTETVSVIPSTVVAAGAGSEATYQRQQPDTVGGTELRTIRAVNSAIIQDGVAQELRVELGAAGPATVVASYGASPALAERVLASLRVAPRGAPVTAQSGSELALSAPAAERLAEQTAPAAAGPAANSTATEQASAQIVQSPRLSQSAPVHPVPGFDTCTAPSLKAMSVWRQRYAAVGVYIGGVNYACSYGNLSATWIRKAASMGYGMLPTYVGPQAPCWGFQGVKISIRHPELDGWDVAADTIRDARLFGLPKGSPIYYDLEAYNSTGWRRCIPPLLVFLGAWDRRVAGAGYKTGVYSSQDSGIADMQKATVDRTRGFTPPDAIWFALWDNDATLSDGTLHWPLQDRSHQYAGDVNQTIGKIKLNIDRDIVGGPVAR